MCRFKRVWEVLVAWCRTGIEALLDDTTHEIAEVWSYDILAVSQWEGHDNLKNLLNPACHDDYGWPLQESILIVVSGCFVLRLSRIRQPLRQCGIPSNHPPILGNPKP